MNRRAGRVVVAALMVGWVAAGCGGPGAAVDPLVVAAEQAAALPPGTSTSTSTIEAGDDQQPATTNATSSTLAADATPEASSTEETTAGQAVSGAAPAGTAAGQERRDRCTAPGVGLSVVVPAEWLCEQVTTPVLGGDAFMLADPTGTTTVTIGVGPHTFACELFDACGRQPLPVSDRFPDTSLFERGGITEISGTHAGTDAYVVIVSNSGGLETQLDTIGEILDSAELS